MLFALKQNGDLKNVKMFVLNFNDIQTALSTRVISSYAHVLISGDTSAMNLNQVVSCMQVWCTEPPALAKFSVML